jgi:hypothetical protein
MATLLVPAMHDVHLLDQDTLNKWLAMLEMRPSPDVNLHDSLPDKDAMCRLYAGFHQVLTFSLYLYAGNWLIISQGMTSRVYVLVLSAFHHRVSFKSPEVELARFSGNSWDPDAPLWVRRLPMHKPLHFPQSLAFVAKLFAGMTDIPRGSVLFVSLHYRCCGRFHSLTTGHTGTRISPSTLGTKRPLRTSRLYIVWGGHAHPT